MIIQGKAMIPVRVIVAVVSLSCSAPDGERESAMRGGLDDAGSLLLETTCDMSDSAAKKCVLWGPSMINLIARPELFDGKAVRVIGFVNFEFEGDAIYLSREDWERKITRNGLWLHPPAIQGDSAALLKRPNKRYAIVEGIFRARNRGHLGLFSGAIEQVTRLDPWEPRLPVYFTPIDTHRSRRELP